MQPDLDALDLTALAAAADVSTRTVRYYIQQGLLPAPEARGPGAHYGAEHLARLKVIKRLQREHLPLSEIRRRLEALPPDEIHRLAAESESKRPRSSARDYIREVMSGGAAMLESPKMMRSAAPMIVRSPARLPEPDPPHADAEPRTPNPASRSQYDRLTLAPDVELHIRRPLSREMNRRVERLLQAARAIFDEENTP
jgi:DNA-binding transcriptional MerR regulator